MASLKDLQNKLKSFFGYSVPQTMARVASSPTLTRTAQNFMSGMQRLSNFGQQAQQRRKQTPVKQYIFPTAKGYAPERFRGMISNYYGPAIKDIPVQLKKTMAPPIGLNVPKPNLGASAKLAWDLFTAIPDISDPLIMAGKYALGGMKAKREGMNIPQSMDVAMRSGTFENPVGLGEAFTSKPGLGQTALNIAEIPIGMLAIGRGAKGFKNYESFVGLDKKLRAEISDLSSRLKTRDFDNLVKQGTARLGDILEHPSLYKNYPDFKKLRISFNSLLGETNGMFNPKTFTLYLNPDRTRGEIRSTLLHELQHTIQEYEGFAKGADINALRNKITKKEIDDYVKVEYNKLIKKGVPKDEAFYMIEDEILPGAENKLAIRKYLNSAGEIEARAVQKREGLTKEMRKKMPFYEEEMWQGGIKRKDVNVDFGKGGFVTGPKFTRNLTGVEKTTLNAPKELTKAFQPPYKSGDIKVLEGDLYGLLGVKKTGNYKSDYAQLMNAKGQLENYAESGDPLARQYLNAVNNIENQMNLARESKAGIKNVVQQPPTFTGKQISEEAKNLGSDQGGLSDWTLKQIAKENYKTETISIDELRKLDPDLDDYLKTSKGRVRKFEGEPNAMNPIVSSEGEVIDGYNRIAQSIKNGEKEVDILRGISTKPPKLVKLTKYDTPEIIKARQMANDIPETVNINTPERIKMREDLVNKYYGNGAAVKKKRFDLVLGSPASGKSSRLVEPLANQHGSLIIDSDMIKKELPEFNNGIGAAATHKESADIADNIILSKALANGDNIVTPRLGKNQKTVEELIQLANDNGYTVHLHFMDLPTNETAKRVVTRFNETGRFVDPEYITNTVDGLPKKVYNAVKNSEGVTTYEHYSNKVPFGQAPKLIERGANEAKIVGRAGSILGQGNVGNIPPSTSTKIKERGFIQTVKTSKRTIPGVKSQLSGYYTPISNKQTLKNANATINELGWDAAKEQAINGPHTAENVAMGESLAQKAMVQGRWDEATDIIEQMSIKGTVGGQATQAFQMWSRLTPTGMIRYAKQIIDKGNKEMPMLSKTVNQILKRKDVKLLPEDTKIIHDLMVKANKAGTEELKAKYIRQVFEHIGKKMPWGVSDLIDEYRYNNMLSNPLTHLRNAVNNLEQAYLVKPATLIAEGRPREAIKYEIAALKAVPDALGAFKESIKSGRPLGKMDVAGITKMQPIKPKRLGLFGLPSDTMEGMDRFFSEIIKQGEMARGKGSDEALKEAEHMLFRSDLKPAGQGHLLNRIDDVTKAVYGLRKVGLGWFIPFIRTPMNVAKQWIEYSPMGLATLPGSVSKRSQLAKMMLGSTATLIGADLALQGRTTWAVPTDPTQKQLFYDSGRKPYSIKIGDKWVPMQSAGVFALALALPAAVKYFNDEAPTQATDDQITKLAKMALSPLGFWSQQTFVSGLGSFVSMAEGNTDYTLPKNIGYTLGQLKPWEGLMRYISTIIDPVFRKPSGIAQQLISDVPGLTKTLPAYTDLAGNPSTRNWSNYVTPYAMGQENKSYEPMYQGRQSELQQNAIVNAAKKQLEAGGQVQGVNGATPETQKKLAELQFKYSDQPFQVLGDELMYKTEDGNVSSMSLNFDIPKPETTGNELLDKEMLSDYKGEITKAKNAVMKAFGLGYFNQEQTISILEKLQSQSNALKKPKKITVKAIKVPKISLKIKKSRIVTPKKMKISMPKAKSIKIKAETPKKANLTIKTKIG